MAPRAPTRHLHGAISSESEVSSAFNRRQVKWIIEGAKFMGGMDMGIVGRRMTFQAVLIVHQGFGLNKRARRGASTTGHEVFFA